MIATYPNFSKLRIDHKNIVNRLTAHTDFYSDFNFVSLFAWNVNGDTELSLLNKNLVIKVPDYVSGKPVLTLIGNKKINDTLDILLQQPLEIKLVPESTIRNIRENPNILVIHDPDNNDYIYDLESVAYLKGGKYKKKRNKLNAFNRQYGDRILFQEFAIGNKEKNAELRACFDSWAKKRGKGEDEVINERKAIHRLLEQSHNFNLKCYEVWIDNAMVGFSINEILDNDYAICHFQKALVHHTNLEIYLNSLVAMHLLNEGCRFANWEQDLGIEGLRQSKSSYAPIKILKKYRIEEARNNG